MTAVGHGSGELVNNIVLSIIFPYHKSRVIIGRCSAVTVECFFLFVDSISIDHEQLFVFIDHHILGFNIPIDESVFLELGPHLENGY